MSDASIAVRKEVWHYQFRTVANLVRCFEGAGLRLCGRFGAADHRRVSCVHRHRPG